jgi:hypothetical protein
MTGFIFISLIILFVHSADTLSIWAVVRFLKYKRGLKYGQEDIRRGFKSIEEAFDSLPQKEREHCIRVSHYAEKYFCLPAPPIYIQMMFRQSAFKA